MFSELFQDGVDLCLGIVDAGQVCHGQYAVVFLQTLGNSKGVFAVAAAACTEGHADKIRVQILERLQGVINGFDGRSFFRRKDLK